MVKYKALSIQKWRLPLAAINLKPCTTNKKQKHILIRWLEINYQPKLRNIPEEWRLQLQRGGSLNSRRW